MKPSFYNRFSRRLEPQGGRHFKLLPWRSLQHEFQPLFHRLSLEYIRSAEQCRGRRLLLVVVLLSSAPARTSAQADMRPAEQDQADD